MSDTLFPVAEQPKGKAFSHDRTADGKEEWLTPPEIIECLGEFDLAPCSPINRPWPTAKRHYTIMDDGLKQPWEGRVWLNPPYGTKTETWMKRLVEHGNGVALIYARTETASFFPWVWDHADAVFFFDRRITFYHVTGIKGDNSGGAPSCLIAYGVTNTQAIITAMSNEKLSGKLLSVRP